MFRLAAVEWLALAPLAVAASWWLWHRRAKHDARTALPRAALGIGVGSSVWQWFDRVLPLLRGAALLLFVLALARPQAGSRLERVVSEGVDIVIALDSSGSMRAEDFRPSNRLEVAKRTAAEFIAGRPSDRIGLVVFAGVATTRCPLTLDHSMLRQFLHAVDFAPPERDGTAIGMGLATAVNRLRDSKAKSRVAVLVTDGRNNQGQIGPTAAAGAARALGITVHTVGVGSEGEAPVPVDAGPLGRRYVMQRVDLDEKLLRELALATGGRYFRAMDPQGLRAVFETIDRLETTKVESQVRMLYTELFPFALAPGLALLVLERWLLATRLMRIP